MDLVKVPELLHPVFKPVMSYVGLGDACTVELLSPVVAWTKPCVTLAISKGLGLGIVVSGAIVKVPQLAKMWGQWSAEGLSYSGYLLESVASSIFVAYNAAHAYPFSTYGESAFIVAQNLAIVVLMAAIQKRAGLAAVLVAVFAVGAALLAQVPIGTLKTLQGVTVPLGIAAKLPPIYAVYSAGSSGALSAVTVFAYFAGTCARIFTTLKEVDDTLILGSFIINGVLNAVLLGQVLYYWNADAAAAKKKADKKVE
ncbi:hypothetical protein H9P43_002771 [Blastocladiella emersonii ATCC 22665]|nr:hypothetical protein H9P43_002771 [Blastocladiella emersonii ATCC 22665]